LPRDAMRKRSLCCHAMSVRPSVRLCLVSVTFVFCVETRKHSQTLTIGSHTLYSFCQYYDRDSMGHQMQVEHEKIAMFNQYVALSGK